MAVHDILRMGDARLLRRAEPVRELDTPELHALVADLFDTMRAAGGAGLAAPQIGVNLRGVVFGTGQPIARYPDAPPVPVTVLVNPVLEPIGTEEQEGWEGCLSVPGLRAVVPRFRHLRYHGFDPGGARLDRTVSDVHARVVQHECDHLDGLLFPDRLVSTQRFGFSEELRAAGLIP